MNETPEPKKGIGPITPGKYRTRCGRTVDIKGDHPRWTQVVVATNWGEFANPGAAWWKDTGVHMHEDENDLVERLKG